MKYEIQIVSRQEAVSIVNYFGVFLAELGKTTISLFT